MTILYSPNGSNLKYESYWPTVDFKQIVKLQHLSIEFYGEWQKVVTHHGTQYLKVKVWQFLKINRQANYFHI